MEWIIAVYNIEGFIIGAFGVVADTEELATELAREELETNDWDWEGYDVIK